MQLEVGKVVKGKVTGITNFGVFVSLEDGKTGLIHISEISKEYINDINSVLKLNQEIKAVVLSIDDKGRVSLSIRRMNEKKTSDSSPDDYFSNQEPEAKSFEDMMHKYKIISEDKISDIKKGVQAKRGTSYKKSRKS